jgi:hypothetical protein
VAVGSDGGGEPSAPEGTRKPMAAKAKRHSRKAKRSRFDACDSFIEVSVDRQRVSTWHAVLRIKHRNFSGKLALGPVACPDPNTLSLPQFPDSATPERFHMNEDVRRVGPT